MKRWSRGRRWSVVAVTLVAVIALLGRIDMGKPTALHHTVQIDASLSTVWTVLADLEAVQHYNPTIDDASYAEGPRSGVGAARTCTVKEGVLKERVTRWEPQKAIEMELYESPWPVAFMRWRTELTPRDGGTWVEQRLEYRIKFGILGALLNQLVMRNKLDQTLTNVFDSMKQYIEERAS